MRMQDQFSLNHCAHNAIMLTNTFFSRVPGSVEWIRNTTTTNLGSLTSRLFIRNKYHLTLLLSEEKDILSDVASFDDADLTIFNTEHLELSSESDSISSPLHHPTKNNYWFKGPTQKQDTNLVDYLFKTSSVGARRLSVYNQIRNRETIVSIASKIIINFRNLLLHPIYESTYFTHTVLVRFAPLYAVQRNNSIINDPADMGRFARGWT